MAIGFRIRDRITGKITLDLTDRISRDVGRIETGLSNGFFDVPASIEGDVYFYCLQSAAFPAYVASVTLSGRRIQWVFNGGTGIPVSNARSISIIYGVY